MDEIRFSNFSHLPGNIQELAFDEAFKLVVDAINILEKRVQELEAKPKSQTKVASR
jgi:hypothetical protein